MKKPFKVSAYRLVDGGSVEHVERFFDDLIEAEKIASQYKNEENVILVGILELDKDKYGFDEYRALQVL